MMSICEFHVKPRGVFFGTKTYDAEAKLCTEDGAEEMYVYIDGTGSEREYVVAKASQMEDNAHEASEEEIEQFEQDFESARFFLSRGLDTIYKEIMMPDGPGYITLSLDEAKESGFWPVFEMLNSVIDLMEEYRFE